MSFLERIKKYTRCDLQTYKPFFMATKQVGWVKQDLIDFLLAHYPDYFVADGQALHLSDRFKNFEERSAALAEITEDVTRFGRVGICHEMFPVISTFGEKPVAAIDRALTLCFGIVGFGVHVNGFTRKDGKLYMWVGERAKNKPVAPGKLDNMIAGGLPMGISPEDNIVKEGMEEAGLPEEIVRKSKHIGLIKYLYEGDDGLSDSRLFVYDLELSPDVIPHNTDGEVAGFTLVPAEEVAKTIRTTDRFKFNCNLIFIDFLVRHGVITAADEEYDDLCAWQKQLYISA